MQRVLVVRPELHEPHVRALRQLGDAADAWEEPARGGVQPEIVSVTTCPRQTPRNLLEHGLHRHDCVTIRQRIFLGRV